jgi:hypothetical protein
MEKILEGNLACFGVPDILTFLNMGHRTGVLALERPSQETKIFFREGKPVYATSSKDELRLGAMLVRLGRVDHSTLERALQQKAGHRIGQALLSQKILEEAELASFLKVQVSEVIFETIEWHEGLFTFWDGVPPPATAVTLEMDLQNLLMEGARRIDERGRLSEVFPNLDMAVDIVANPDRVKQSVNFTPEEWKVFFLVDGRRSVSEICRLAGNAEESSTLQILHNLIVAKFLTVVAPPDGAPSEPDIPAAAEGSSPNATLKFAEDKGTPPAGSVSVEFVAEKRAPKPEDDTKEIVSPKAVQYSGGSQKLTVSRLILTERGEEKSFPLARDTYTLGRHRNNDIVISDPKVSSFHARIDRTPDAFMLVDLKSRNGSFVNGKRIETAPLKTGDEVRLGTARLLYKVDYTALAT